jgi:hypothetical protein
MWPRLDNRRSVQDNWFGQHYQLMSIFQVSYVRQTGGALYTVHPSETQVAVGAQQKVCPVQRWSPELIVSTA